MRHGIIISMTGIVISLMIGVSVANGWDDNAYFKQQKPKLDEWRRLDKFLTDAINASVTDLQQMENSYQRHLTIKPQAMFWSSTAHLSKIALSAASLYPPVERIALPLSHGMNIYDSYLRSSGMQGSVDLLAADAGSSALNKFGSTGLARAMGKRLGHATTLVGIGVELESWRQDRREFYKMDKQFADNFKTHEKSFHGFQEHRSLAVTKFNGEIDKSYMRQYGQTASTFEKHLEYYHPLPDKFWHDVPTTKQYEFISTVSPRSAEGHFYNQTKSIQPLFQTGKSGNLSTNPITNISWSTVTVENYLQGAQTRNDLISRTLDVFEVGYRPLGTKNWRYTGSNSSFFNPNLEQKIRDNMSWQLQQLQQSSMQKLFPNYSNNPLKGSSLPNSWDIPKTSGMGMGASMGGYGMGSSMGSNIGSGYGMGSSMGRNMGYSAGSNIGSGMSSYGMGSGSRSGYNAGYNVGSNIGSGGYGRGSSMGSSMGSNIGSNIGSGGYGRGSSMGSSMGSNIGSNIGSGRRGY